MSFDSYACAYVGFGLGFCQQISARFRETEFGSNVLELVEKSSERAIQATQNVFNSGMCLCNTCSPTHLHVSHRRPSFRLQEAAKPINTLKRNIVRYEPPRLKYVSYLDGAVFDTIMLKTPETGQEPSTEPVEWWTHDDDDAWLDADAEAELETEIPNDPWSDRPQVPTSTSTTSPTVSSHAVAKSSKKTKTNIVKVRRAKAARDAAQQKLRRRVVSFE